MTETSTEHGVTYVRTANIPLDELTPFPGNAKRGDVDQIRKSLRRNGQYRSLVVREIPDGPLIVLAGNHTMQALAGEGHATARCEVVLCDEDTARRINLADNRTAELGGYDNDALAELLSYMGGDLEGTGYTDADVEALITPLEDADELDDADGTPPPPADPVTQPGDVWILGPHRLMCGDSTNPDDLARLAGEHQPDLIYTDPPYGIKAVPKDGGASRTNLATAQAYAPVAGDDNTEVAADAFRLLTTEYPTARHVWWGGNHFASSAALPDSSCWLIWDKENGSNDFADAELAWTNHTGAVRMLSHMWNGMLRASERDKRVHPTQKPVALAEWAFTVVDPDHTRETVLDVFGGSGSTLLACHTTGRVGLLMEMAPAYIDVICRRYQQASGTQPVLESTGEAHDFTPQDGDH
ncbi:DNA methyltransferase [Streptomyces sp. NPDC056982]|uniref:DNA methyltransferase n=1 Tax=Streptomyces sp. NPDC056982 TaxID=3345986 RepID=UPI00362B0179